MAFEIGASPRIYPDEQPEKQVCLFRIAVRSFSICILVSIALSFITLGVGVEGVTNCHL